MLIFLKASFAFRVVKEVESRGSNRLPVVVPAFSSKQVRACLHNYMSLCEE